METKLEHMFDKPNIVGIIGNQNEGKSNLLYYLIDELRKEHTFKLYIYGMRAEIEDTTKIYSVGELEQIKNSVIIIDELFSLFDLDNRKIKGQIESTIRLLFHNNNIIILSGLGENYKKFISAKLTAVIYKKVTISDLINGSSVKTILLDYRGIERGSAVLNMDIDEALLWDGKHYEKISVPYLNSYDTKRENCEILVRKNVQILCKKGVMGGTE